MAKIIYGVAGEGFGHSSRAHLIGQRLIDAGHEIMFVGSAKSLSYLTQYFGDAVKAIHGLSFAFDDGRIDKSETLKKNLINLPRGTKLNQKLFKQNFEPFAPDLVISDFEPFCAWWAWRKKVPFISIDNEHVLTLCKLDHPSDTWFSRTTAQAVTKLHYVGAAAYVIINFFEAPLRIDSAVLAPPIVRPAVTELKPIRAGHIVVYSTAAAQEENLRRVLGRFPDRQFYIYGFDTVGRFDNCIFKERSTDGFLADLAGAAGVIASAGFSLLSEAMYLKKKMLLLPVAGQYEQMLNAHYVEKLGLGLNADELDEDALTRYLELVETPMPDNPAIIWPDNDEFFRVLQRALDKLPTPVSIARA